MYNEAEKACIKDSDIVSRIAGICYADGEKEDDTTGYIFRNVRSKFYPDVTAYYTPFISPDEHSFCGRREYQDILPEHNEGIHLIPQIMANKS